MDLFEKEENRILAEKEERLKEMKLELKEMKFKVANQLVNGNYWEAKQGFNSILELINQINDFEFDKSKTLE